MENNGVRLDTWLVQQGYASGREKAKELIAAGYVLVNGVPVTKASRTLRPGEEPVCQAPAAKYVGRGGYKLEKALAGAELTLTGVVAMDVGASTGGFTDCMLKAGAAHVYAVDVGHDQLHATLRADSRVTVLEGTDVRSRVLAETVPAGSITFCSVDVSFVSLAHVLPAVLPYLAETAALVCLIKPQFEAGKAGIGKHGVVRDRKVHARVLAEQLTLFGQLGLAVKWLSHSPITGGEGNIEYLAVLGRQGTGRIYAPAAVVAAAFQELT